MGIVSNSWIVVAVVVVIVGCLLSPGLVAAQNATSETKMTSGGTFNGEYTASEEHMLPKYIVLRGDEPCLLAAFNVSLSISYKVPSSIPHQSTDKVVMKNLPLEAEVSGTCGENASSLQLSWENGTYTLQLDFEVGRGSDNTTLQWAATNLTLTFSTDNETVFPDAVFRGEVTMVRDRLHLFAAPLGKAYMCEVDQKVLLTNGDKSNGAAVDFDSVHVQPFVVLGRFFSNNTGCQEDAVVQGMQKERFIVPIVVAVSLVVIVLVVIASYAVSRRINAARDQQAYRSMD